MFYLVSEETKVREWGRETGIRRHPKDVLTGQLSLWRLGLNSTGETLGARVEYPIKRLANESLYTNSCQSLFEGFFPWVINPLAFWDTVQVAKQTAGVREWLHAKECRCWQLEVSQYVCES